MNHDPIQSADPETHAMNDPKCNPERGRRAVLRRRLGGSVAAGLLVATGLTVVSCGGREPETATILNTEKVERAIERSVSVQRGKSARVSCPSGVHQKKGLTFSCTATVKRVNTRFVVTQQNGAGRVRYAAR